MFRGQIRRLEKWANNYSGGSVPLKTQPLLGYLRGIMQIAFANGVRFETLIRLILSEAETPVILNPFYLNFGREVWKAMRKFSGGQLLIEVDTLLNKYVGRGLDRDILEKIRNTVFALAAPAP